WVGPRDERVLAPVQLGGEGTGRAARASPPPQAVEARVVENSGFRAAFVGRRCTKGCEPLRSARASAGGVDDDRRGDDLSIGQPDAGDARSRAMADLAQNPFDTAPLAKLDPAAAPEARVQRPLEGRASRGEKHDILIVDPWRQDDARRSNLVQADLPHPGRAQAVEDVREVREEDDAQAGEEGMRVTELRDSW